MQSAGENGFAKEDVDLGRFLVATAKTLIAPGNVPASSAKNERSQTAEALALFLFALKDVDQLDMKDATSLLEQFVAAGPAGKFAWINRKPLAQKYRDDVRLYGAWKARGQPEASGARLAMLGELKKKLKMRSAISEAVSSEERSLGGRGGDQPVAEEQTAKAPKNVDPSTAPGQALPVRQRNERPGWRLGKAN